MHLSSQPASSSLPRLRGIGFTLRTSWEFTARLLRIFSFPVDEWIRVQWGRSGRAVGIECFGGVRAQHTAMNNASTTFQTAEPMHRTKTRGPCNCDCQSRCLISYHHTPFIGCVLACFPESLQFHSPCNSLASDPRLS